MRNLSEAFFNKYLPIVHSIQGSRDTQGRALLSEIAREVKNKRAL